MASSSTSRFRVIGPQNLRACKPMPKNRLHCLRRQLTPRYTCFARRTLTSTADAPSVHQTSLPPAHMYRFQCQASNGWKGKETVRVCPQICQVLLLLVTAVPSASAGKRTTTAVTRLGGTTNCSGCQRSWSAAVYRSAATTQRPAAVTVAAPARVKPSGTSLNTTI